MTVRSHRRSAFLVVAAGLAAATAACTPAVPPSVPAVGDGALLAAHEAFSWNLPTGMPPPRVPADNPMTPLKVSLGRRLFYDKRLSVNGTTSCASCHEQAKAFSDGKPVPTGATGSPHTRNSMGLGNAAYAGVLTWGNPLMADLETQALVPLTGENPIEIGFGEAAERILPVLRADPVYATGFRQAFPEESDPIRLPTIVKAIACFERTMLSFDSPYDKAQRGDRMAMTEAARRGADLFFGERLECAHCHDAPFFTDTAVTSKSIGGQILFHNTGLFNLDGKGRYPDGGTGVYEVTQKPNDMGKFKAPGLRNVAMTAPYFHDGSAATLADVLDHYKAGGRTITSGPHAGAGSANPLKAPLIGGFPLTDTEKADVIAFLESLTDQPFLTRPDLSDPFAPQSRTKGEI